MANKLTDLQTVVNSMMQNNVMQPSFSLQDTSIRDCQVRRILIDRGSFGDIMYVRWYKEFGLHKDDLEQSDNLMVGFNGTPTWPLGTMSLEMQVGSKKVIIEFNVIDTPSTYNIILERPWLHVMRVVPSTLHQLLQFQTEQGIKEVRGDQVQVKNCFMVAMKYTSNVRESESAENESEDHEVLDDVGKELAD
ncbi:uncharacterized protein LOC114264732 [Camellia sinensis]|uniref:uncharacterized protein LOC114264732 n=1 Tax=Camellia sinensis TaxID=4442 RepID=UPI001036C398|nr:uncharacterized protein LOC114264732 [Camellia sinensis]